jgi:hypothetical protein
VCQCVSVCVCVCTRARACVCARERVRVCVRCRAHVVLCKSGPCWCTSAETQAQEQSQSLEQNDGHSLLPSHEQCRGAAAHRGITHTANWVRESQLTRLCHQVPSPRAAAGICSRQTPGSPGRPGPPPSRGPSALGGARIGRGVHWMSPLEDVSSARTSSTILCGRCNHTTAGFVLTARPKRMSVNPGGALVSKVCYTQWSANPSCAPAKDAACRKNTTHRILAPRL